MDKKPKRHTIISPYQKDKNLKQFDEFIKKMEDDKAGLNPISGKPIPKKKKIKRKVVLTEKPKLQFNILDLNDICLELSDMLFNVDILFKPTFDNVRNYVKYSPSKSETQDQSKYKFLIIKISLGTREKARPFEYSKIKEVVERIVDYMGMCGFRILQIKDFHQSTKTYRSIHNIEELSYENEIFQLGLTYDNPMFTEKIEK